MKLKPYTKWMSTILIYKIYFNGIYDNSLTSLMEFKNFIYGVLYNSLYFK